MQYKAEDAARLTPCEDDNAVLRKSDLKDCLFLVGDISIGAAEARRNDEMVSAIKRIARSAADTVSPCTFIFGTVVGVEPLSVRVDSRFFVGGEALITMKPLRKGEYSSHGHRHVCRYTGEEVGTKEGEDCLGLRTGDKLALMREHGGQRFLVLGVVE